MTFEVNNKIIKDITNSEVFVDRYIFNGDLFYDLVIKIEFKYNDKKGNMYLSVGKEKSKDISLFTNKKYKLKQMDNILLEIYDTETYVDSEIETPITVITKEIINNELQIEIYVNDKYLKLSLSGSIKIK